MFPLAFAYAKASHKALKPVTMMYRIHILLLFEPYPSKRHRHRKIRPRPARGNRVPAPRKSLARSVSTVAAAALDAGRFPAKLLALRIQFNDGQ